MTDDRFPAEARNRLAGWRQAAEKVVFTNGVFDLLHRGHVEYLEEAAGLGDRLVVGINADASVRRLKGDQRPLVPEHERAELVAALQCVDLCVIFDEDTPERLIREVGPDIVVTLDPDHGDGHRDHEAIARATIAACAAHPDIRLYAWVLPRRFLGQWFTELEQVRPDSEHLDLDRQGIGRPEDDITTVVDVAHLRPLREQAFTMHASQVSPMDGMSDGVRAAFLERDHFVRLQPPWSGGERETSLF